MDTPNPIEALARKAAEQEKGAPKIHAAQLTPMQRFFVSRIVDSKVAQALQNAPRN